ncbi:uncharacterized protein TNCV_1341251 [Trichonephila clavipes]|uniref:Uncharacterized protein n=1 Tax=Trichonephila clavipes TaxID=2585209 RepID=A0A8X6RZ32_TRICX|nr:uncharacterized protein TNCV_1341251 [Trichonephila clavipes]
MIRAHYEQLSKFERGRIIGLKEAGGIFGESLVIWLLAMRPLEDTGKNGLTIADLNVMMVHCRARLEWCLDLSGWKHADWGRIMFSDESRFYLCLDDHRRRVWRRPGQRAKPAFTIAGHTGSQPEVMLPGLFFSHQGISKPHTARVAMSYQSLSNTFLASQIARILSNQACLGYDKKANASTMQC